MKNNNLQIKLSWVFIILLIFNNITFAQEDEGNLPVRHPWTTSILIDNQTTETPNKTAFEFRIHHRFGKIKEISDLFGIYAASNIRLGIDYGITDKLMIGYGTEKFNMMQEFQIKYKILTQNRSGKMPLSVSIYGNAVINAQDKDFFGKDYAFSKRMSYFTQLIIGKKFNKKLSLQTSISYAHYNAVDSLWLNDYMGAHIGGRFKFSNKMSFIAEYNYPFAIQHAKYYQNEPKPDLGLGLEIGTSTHAFQIFAAQYRSIIAQENLSHNLNDISDWYFGFNITVRF